VTLLAHAGQHALIAGLGARMQQGAGVSPGATAQPLDMAPLPAPVPVAGFRIAVVGAHMSGLPLNHELTSRGARFLCTARTAPAWALFALAGGPPVRPGLLRVARGDCAIDLELWQMPMAEFDGFLPSIPSPLGIGTDPAGRWHNGAGVSV